MDPELVQERISTGEGPSLDDLLLEVECVPETHGTLLTVRSDVLEPVVMGFLKGGKEVTLPDGIFSPPGAPPIKVRTLGRYEEWNGPSFMRAPDPEMWYTELGGQYNSLPLLAMGLKEGVRMVMGPTSKPMRDAYVAALLNWAEDLFRTYGDTRGVRGVLRSVRNV